MSAHVPGDRKSGRAARQTPAPMGGWSPGSCRASHADCVIKADESLTIRPSPASAAPAVVSIALLRLLIVAGAVNEHLLRRRCAPEQQATSPASRSRPSHT